ncbi:site-specific DNA-methyltransferase [Paracoccus luteus]|uniref:site-specific DNA-methyltransferase n=1 Tax=Paracoccus luteus TaxID=2508543 RepID=UPI00106F5C13|nr:DNA methyltransferase [Paracoccus luteus]
MNHLYYGDNLAVLRDHIPDDSVDLIYLDPPFNSNASYNVLFRSPTGDQSAAQIEAFDDTWHWGDEAETAFQSVRNSGHTDAATMLEAMRSFLGTNDMMAYLAMMAVRLIELHRVLKPTGSLYLHCDPTASHYLKILLDAVFGAGGFRNEISWRRSSAHSDTKQGMDRLGKIRDVILFYTKGKSWLWNPQYSAYNPEYFENEYRHKDDNGRLYKETDATAAKSGGDVSYEWRVKRRAGEATRWQADVENEHLNPQEGWDYLAVPPYVGRYWAYSRANLEAFWHAGKLVHRETGMPRIRHYADEMPGVPLQDDWGDIQPASGAERLGYPTQKPVALLERIVAASSNPGDVVLDPFCGCGTTVHAAQKLGRQWIGIDVTHLAIGLIERRLNEAFSGVAYKVHGTPQDLSAAHDMFARDDTTKKEFEKWAVSLIGAQPWRAGKKGADGGIDGRLPFGRTNVALVSVKGGKDRQRNHIDQLRAVIDREKADIGVFLTLHEPTAPMRAEAAGAGQFQIDGFDPVPRIQIVTVEQAMALRERAVKIPLARADTFRKPAREEDATRQSRLDL